MAKIVVGIDGSASSALALSWAVEEGALRQWPVQAVLAWTYLAQHKTDPAQSFNPDYSESDAFEALKHYVEQAVGKQAADKLEQTVVCDLPANALLDTSKNSHLLVVGARGLGGFKGLLVGSVAQQCLAHSTRPVAIIRSLPTQTSEPHVQRIVVGIDGSDAAARALHWAVAEARLRQAELEVVHAWHVPYTGGYVFGTGAYDPSIFEEAAGETLDEAVDAVDAGGLDHPIRRTIHGGGAAEAILSAAKSANLVIVGTRGLGGFTGLLLGSVSHQVAHHAACPVVLIPE